VIVFHRYVGLILGIWLTLMGLSGSILVYYKEIDAALNPGLMHVDHRTAKPDVDMLLGKVRAKYPDRQVLYYERSGDSDLESYPFMLSKKLAMTPAGPDASGIMMQEGSADLEVFVDPADGKILGDRPYHTVLRTIHSLHEELLTPKPGQIIVALLGLTTVLSVIAGVVVWWRQSRRRLGKALKIDFSSPTPKLVRDTHTVMGIYVAVFLLVQATSGSLINTYFPLSMWISSTFGPAKPPMKMPPMPVGPPPPTITANAARDVGVSAHPNSDAVQIVFPIPNNPTYSVRIFPRDESRTRHLRQTMLTATGMKLFTFDPDTIPMPSRIFMAYSIWLHNGQFWGFPGRIVVLLTGLTLSTMFPTGLYMWLRRRKSRKARESQLAGA
jgi:uncharacterized iron-regulated membrane protein